MRIEIAGCGGGHERGYPVLRCARCSKIWHLPQSVRRHDLDRREGRARAITAGWTVPEEGPCYCETCTAPEYPECCADIDCNQCWGTTRCEEHAVKSSETPPQDDNCDCVGFHTGQCWTGKASDSKHGSTMCQHFNEPFDCALCRMEHR